MQPLIDLRVTELLCARLCHELAGPVAAIGNGIEFLGEEATGFDAEAIALIGDSARKARQRLQFYRFAYGPLGSEAAGDPRALAEALLEGGRTRLEWRPDASNLAREWLRLACNLVVVAADMLPRGGAVEVSAGRSESAAIEIGGEGQSVTLTEAMRSALELRTMLADLGSKDIHAHFTADLARSLGARLIIMLAGAQRFSIVARKEAA
jgi:histidine phosphotransferase ChpT